MSKRIKSVAFLMLAVMMLFSAVAASASTTSTKYIAISINGKNYVKGIVNAADVSFRSGPGKSYSRTGPEYLDQGTELGVVLSSKGYYKVLLTDGQEGYVAQEYIDKQVAGTTQTTTPTQTPAQNTGTANTGVASGDHAAAAAQTAAELEAAAAAAGVVPKEPATTTVTGAATSGGAWTPPTDIPQYSVPAKDQAVWDDFDNLIAKYKKINSHTNGYIHVPNTNISMPTVVYKDNDYYLERDIYKKKNKYAVPYFDYRNQNANERRHLLLYGHNMQVSETIFNNFIKYGNVSFYKNNPVVKIEAYGATLWEVISARKVKPNSSHIKTKFASDDAWLAYIQDIQKKGAHYGKVPTIPLRANDQILTIVTCDRSTMKKDGYKSRYLVSFRRIA